VVVLTNNGSYITKGLSFTNYQHQTLFGLSCPVISKPGFMKSLLSVTAVCVVMSIAVMAKTGHSQVAAKDTVRKQKNPPPRHIVHGRAARMRLQLKQIKYHDKQLKKVDSAQKELDKETHKSN
jgi:hypothetical protein